jgi:hypothetical protein
MNDRERIKRGERDIWEKCQRPTGTAGSYREAPIASCREWGVRMRRRSGKMPYRVRSTHVHTPSLWSPLPGATRAKPSGIAGMEARSSKLEARISLRQHRNPFKRGCPGQGTDASAHSTRQVLSSPPQASSFASFLMELAAHSPFSVPSPYFRPR